MALQWVLAGILVGLLGDLGAGVVARVDGEAVYLSELQERVERTRAAGGAPRADLLTSDLVNEVLMAREARRRGLARDPEVVAAVAAERRKLSAKVLERELGGSVRVTEAQVAEVFHKSADTVNVEGVVLASEEDARAAFERLKNGAKLADEAAHSYDVESAKNGGKMGPKSRGQLEPALSSVLFTAPIGTFVGPVKLELGWAVVRVTARQLGDDADLASRRDALRKFVEAQTRQQVRVHYIMQLRKQNGVALDEAFIRSTGTRLDATADEAAHAVATVGTIRVPYGQVVLEVRRLFGGKQGGHASGPSVKTEISWSLVDTLLLEKAAMDRGFGDAPEVKAKLPGIERDALVRRLASELRGSTPDHSDEPVRRMIASLRAPARIETDLAAVGRAASTQP